MSTTSNSVRPAEPCQRSDAEKSLLGACLLDSKIIDAAIADGLTGDSFHGAANRLIFGIFLDLRHRGGPVNDGTIIAALASGNRLACAFLFDFSRCAVTPDAVALLIESLTEAEN